LLEIVFSKEQGFLGVLHTVKGSLELEVKARRVFKLREKLWRPFEAIVDGLDDIDNGGRRPNE
jgi:hypothetical protein